MKQRANVKFCEIGQDVHRNISNVTEDLWGQSIVSHLRKTRAQCGKAQKNKY